jgi:hypothetical protein
VQRLALLALAAALLAGASGAELYRCLDPGGELRFSDSAHGCDGAVPHAPERRIERIEPSPGARPPATRTPDLAALLLSAAETAPGWEVVPEAVVDPSGDPDLVAWGVREQRARHYTRLRADTTEVCSLELWAFDGFEQAAAAVAGFAYPDWQITREGEILLMVRGLRRAPGVTPQRGVFAACEALGARVRARLPRHDRTAEPQRGSEGGE